MTQEQALEILKTGANVFLTGEPGSGKTYVINKYVTWLEAAGLKVAVTASTGIAATHIGGLTIHSWSGIGIKDNLTPQDLDAIASKEKIVKRAQKTDVLIIDEISMLSNGTLKMVDQVLRTVRQKPEAFGGLQIICVGDFFQLPPIVRGGDVVSYAFESTVWDNSKFVICYLTEQHRQEDEMLLGLLNSIRGDKVEDEHYTLLSEQIEIKFEHVEPTRLYTHNLDVDSVNQKKLSELPTPIRKYAMTSKGSKALVSGLVKNCLSPEMLELKEGAMVMCTKNNFEAGYVNGTLAQVIHFDNGLPVIETLDGRKIQIKPVSWEIVEDGKVLASIEQLPLRLAWAITVHKSQGMSLDAAEVDLSKAFVYGQGYVALSRVRSLDGLRVVGMHANALRVDPRVSRQDERFKLLSQAAQDKFVSLDPEIIKDKQKKFIERCGGKWPKEGDLLEGGRSGTERLKAESTTALTKQFLLDGKQVDEIAKLRELTVSTIWNHLEKLQVEGDLKWSDLKHLIPDDCDWTEITEKFKKPMVKFGTEKLKPLFEATGEKYDYNLIRLVRLWFLLKENDNEMVF